MWQGGAVRDVDWGATSHNGYDTMQRWSGGGGGLAATPFAAHTDTLRRGHLRRFAERELDLRALDVHVLLLVEVAVL